MDGRIVSYATEAEIYATTNAFNLDILNKTREEYEWMHFSNSHYENSHYNHIFLNERPSIQNSAGIISVQC